MAYGMIGQQTGPAKHVETMPRMSVDPKTGKLRYGKTQDQREREAVKRSTGGTQVERHVDTKRVNGKRVHTVTNQQQRVNTDGRIVWNRGLWSIRVKDRDRHYDFLTCSYTGTWDTNVIDILYGDTRTTHMNIKQGRRGTTKVWRLSPDGNVNGTHSREVPAHVLEQARLIQAEMVK